MLTFPHSLDRWLTDGGEVVSLTCWLPTTPRKIPVLIFVTGLVDPRAVVLEGLGIESAQVLTYKTGCYILSCVKKIEKLCCSQSCMLSILFCCNFQMCDTLKPQCGFFQ
jgi:hypothetical protein